MFAPCYFEDNNDPSKCVLKELKIVFNSATGVFGGANCPCEDCEPHIANLRLNSLLLPAKVIKCYASFQNWNCEADNGNLKFLWSPSLTSAILDYNYGGLNEVALFVDHFNLTQAYVSAYFKKNLFSVESAQVINGQDIWEYHLHSELDPKGKYWYLSKYTPDLEIGFVFSEPIAVPYSSTLQIKINLQEATGKLNFNEIESIWTAKIDYSQEIASGSFTGKEAIIEIPAPNEVKKSNLSIKFDFKIKGSNEILNSHTIGQTLYTIIDYSKKLADDDKPPMKSMIDLAISYNKSAKSEELATYNIITGIFNDPIHYYNPSPEEDNVFVQALDACDNANFLYKKLYDNRSKSNESNKLHLDCLASSYLASTLLRSIGVNSDTFGFLKSSKEFDTNKIFTFGHYRKNGSPIWESIRNLIFHQLNSRGSYLYDSVPHFRDNPRDDYGFPVINMEESTYRNYFFKNGDRSGQRCPNPGLSSTDYKSLIE